MFLYIGFLLANDRAVLNLGEVLLAADSLLTASGSGTGGVMMLSASTVAGAFVASAFSAGAFIAGAFIASAFSAGGLRMVGWEKEDIKSVRMALEGII